MPDRRARRAVVLILALHWTGSIVLWPGVTDHLPLGPPDPAAAQPAEPTWWSWFGLPLLSCLLVGCVLGVARWLGRYPLFLGLEGRRRFRALPEDGRDRVLGVVGGVLELLALPIALLFLLVHIGVREALAGRSSLPWTLGGLLVSILGFSVLVVVQRTLVERSLEREWRRAP